MRAALASRCVRVESIVLDRTLTLSNPRDLDKGELRQFTLDRVLASLRKRGISDLSPVRQRFFGDAGVTSLVFPRDSSSA